MMIESHAHLRRSKYTGTLRTVGIIGPIQPAIRTRCYFTASIPIQGIAMLVKDLLSFSEITPVMVTDDSAGLEIHDAAVSELMSDVLTMEHDNLLLITGLCTDQAIRTADIMGAVAVIITQGKHVSESMKKIAHESGISLFKTDLQNFSMCQLLCGSGKFPLH